MVFKKNLSLKREKIIAENVRAENSSIANQNTNASTCNLEIVTKARDTIDCVLRYENVNSIKATKNIRKVVKIGDKDEENVDATPRKARVAIGDCLDDRPSVGKTRKNKQRQLTCDFCQKKFSHTGDYNKHRRKHTGERPYTCNKCQQKFSHVSNLVRHQRVHSGIRPFSCEICGRSFARKDKLSDHLTTKSCNTKIRNQIDRIATKQNKNNCINYSIIKKKSKTSYK